MVTGLLPDKKKKELSLRELLILVDAIIGGPKDLLKLVAEAIDNVRNAPIAPLYNTDYCRDVFEAAGGRFKK